MSTEIELILEQDSGLDIGAAILFEGITLGRITSFAHIDPQTRKITAQAQISPRIEKYLTEDTDFFVVSPEIDLSGVTNLSSLLTGSYIGVRPSVKGEKQKSFTVYNHKPAYKYNVPGLHLMLKTKNIASIHVGSGIYYKQQLVGDIQAVENTGPDQFIIHAFIKPQYQQYVSSNSRFWHDSGLSISGGLQNFEIKAKSLQTILSGGISFDIGEETNNTVVNGDDFTLYASKEMAKQRLTFTLEVATSRGIAKNTRIIYRGEKIGEIHEIINQGASSLIKVGIVPSAQHILKKGSQFWIVRPDLTLSGLTDTDALFGGAYIAVNIGEGEPHSHFILNLASPAKHSSSQGLQLSLTTSNGSIVTPGSSISYRGITVGQVDNIALEASGANVHVNITIFEEYRHLVSNYSRFYNASGITVSGGLNGLAIKTESADAILRGAISFYNPERPQVMEPAAENTQYSLFDHIDQARSAGLAIEIHFNDFSGLTDQTAINYQNQKIGHVERLVFSKNNHGVTAFAYLNDNARKFSVDGTQFWLAEPELGLVGSKNVSSILSGGFINLIPGDGVHTTTFKAADIPPVVKRLPYGLNIQLSAQQLGSIRVGNPVLYRQVTVGEVLGVDLSKTANSVNIYINIADKYAPLVSTKSKFWNTSGFSIEAGLFSGVKVDSQSIESLLAGGIAFATPDANNTIKPDTSGTVFTLHDMPEESWLMWQPKISIE